MTDLKHSSRTEDALNSYARYFRIIYPEGNLSEQLFTLNSWMIYLMEVRGVVLSTVTNYAHQLMSLEKDKLDKQISSIPSAQFVKHKPCPTF